MSKLEVRILVGTGSSESEITYYVRAVSTGRGFVAPVEPRDAWAAYSETTTAAGGPAVHERVSDAPRATLEEAAYEMHVRVAQRLAREGRLCYGELPADLDEEWRAERALADEASRDPRLASDLADG